MVAINLANCLIKRHTMALSSSTGELESSVSDSVIRYTPDGNNIPSRLEVLRYAFNVIGSFKPTIIHAHTLQAAIPFAIAAKIQNPPIPIIITRHLPAPAATPVWIFNFALQTLFDSLIAISNSTYRSLTKGIPTNRIAFLPNPINLELFHITPSSRKMLRDGFTLNDDDFTIVTASRLITEKGVDTVIESTILAARKTDQRIVLFILGDGPARQSLEVLASYAPPNLVIRFVGYIRNVHDYLKAADLFLFATRFREVLPLCLIEAMAAQLPIVCSSIPGNLDVVTDGVNGDVIAGGIEQFSTSILRFLNNPALRRLVGENNARQAQQTYSEYRIIAAHEQIYASLVNQHIGSMI